MSPVNSQAAGLISLNIVLPLTATVAVALRMVSIRVRKRTLQAHDFLCVLSLLCLYGYTIDLMVGAVHGGLGLHIEQLPLAKVVIALKVFFASEFFWSTGVASFRLAIILLYIDIFKRPGFLRAAYATAVLVGLYYVACILTVCLLCRPINYNWNRTIKGSCANTVAVEIYSAAFNMVLDVWVVCLPLPIVWQLQMPTQKKVGISATFALGLAIAGINLGRLVQTLQCDEKDFTYCLRGSSMLCVGEMSSGILVACVPSLGPVFFPDRFGPKAKPRYRYNNSDKRPLHNAPAGRNERPYKTLEDDGVELKAALSETNDFDTGADSRSPVESSRRQI